MLTTHGNDQLRKALTRSRPPREERRDVADALFREHLDLAAIRKALGQPLAHPIRGSFPALAAEVERTATVAQPSEARAKEEVAPVTAAAEDLPSPALSSRSGRPRAVALATSLAIACLIVAWSGGEALQARLGGAWGARPPIAIPSATVAPPARRAAAARPAPVSVPKSLPDSGPAIGIPSLSALPLMASTRMAQISVPAPVPPAHGTNGAPALPAAQQELPERPRLAPLRHASAVNDAPPEDLALLARAELPSGGRPNAFVTTTGADAALVIPMRRPTNLATLLRARPASVRTTRAVVHYHRAPPPALRASLGDKLSKAGFGRVEWRAVKGAVSASQIRFFHGADTSLSTRALAVLSHLGQPASARDFTHFEPPTRVGTIEIWLSDQVTRPREEP